MPPGISTWTAAVPWRYCRINTTSPVAVVAITLTQSGAWSPTKRRSAPVRGWRATMSWVVKMR
jgi:hypothetical protein